MHWSLNMNRTTKGLMREAEWAGVSTLSTAIRHIMNFNMIVLCSKNSIGNKHWFIGRLDNSFEIHLDSISMRGKVRRDYRNSTV